MDVKITPVLLEGNVDIKSSKSDVHRLLICAALANESTEILIKGISEDIQATINCLEKLGAKIVEKTTNVFYVEPIKRKPINMPQKPKDIIELDCGESGSTLRFLLPVAAALGNRVIFKGKGRLPTRPLEELKKALIKHGCVFKNLSSEAYLPLSLEGKVTSGIFSVPGNISSQFITGLLLSFPILNEESTINLTTFIQSKGYIDLTINTMKKFGVNILEGNQSYTINRGEYYSSPLKIEAEGDWSNAAFWIVAGALASPITCHGLNDDSLQGDKKIVSLLVKSGALLNWNLNSLKSSRGNSQYLESLEIDASEIPDLVPILAVLATAANGITKIYNANRLRMKESDRLLSTANFLNALGGQVEETEDSLIIKGLGSLRGGIVDSVSDHRIAMAATIASVICKDPVIIQGAEAVNKSYPDFFNDFKQLGGFVDVI